MKKIILMILLLSFFACSKKNNSQPSTHNEQGKQELLQPQGENNKNEILHEDGPKKINNNGIDSINNPDQNNADFNKIKGDWIDEWSVTIVKEKAYQFKKTIGLRINNNKSGG